jgi:uncharacterized protein with FMN-binding domain
MGDTTNTKHPASSATDSAATPAQVASFITRWQGVQLTAASELSTSQTFILDLCALLGVPTPLPSLEQDYLFERPVTFQHGDGSTSSGRIDCYKRSAFVWESKKLRNTPVAGKRFDIALLAARAQAENYARALPAAEVKQGRPPFLVVADIGHVLEIYADFTQSGATYTPFPDPRHHRITLADLHDDAIRTRLAQIWLDPLALDPSRASARVTREVSEQLASLAKSLEQSGHRADHVAAFLTRCLFSMFAEDVELLPKGSFAGLLEKHGKDPATLQRMLQALWADMDSGGFSAALATQVLKFNGKLFKQPTADGYSLLLNAEQIKRLTKAACSNWREVEPAIFGTLLERALHVDERHALGAHYTPRAYVERLVLPTVVEPLRQQWQLAQAAALVLASEAAELSGKAADAKMQEAREHIKQFLHQLCTLRVLDPACGSGNFLYVTLEHLKRLEGEVINQLEALGEKQSTLGLEGETVSPRQLLGIELNERAAALAELVLWIGYLQWHIRTRGNKAVAEPVVHDFGNIEHRDAVLAWDDTDLARDADGNLLTRWDGKTFKTHPATGEQVPDETAVVPQWAYIRPQQAAWPQADFIVGNPPFIGASTMRAALGDGYVQALRSVWPEVPESADFVMHWWSRCAALVSFGSTLRFGLITTNSLRQTFNRRVVQAALDGKSVFSASRVTSSSLRSDLHPVRPELVEGSGLKSRAPGAASGGAGFAGPLILGYQKSVPSKSRPTAVPVALAFAIADHPWVDNANGAAVRIAMTVGVPAPQRAALPAKRGKAKASVQAEPASAIAGHLFTVTSETTGDYGEVTVTVTEKTGQIHADLSVGANVTSAVALQANDHLCYEGIKPHGMGFVVTPEEAVAIGLGSVPDLDKHIRHYRNGRDLTDVPRGVMIIDFFGLKADEVRAKFPAAYQWILERVKPERDQNNRATYRDNWWYFGEPRKDLRPKLLKLSRYVATVKTAKHFLFQFLDSSVLPDSKVISVCHNESWLLGVLSSSIHRAWSHAQGSNLGVGNDPTYVISRCFETFPFPDEDTGLTPALRERIASLAEQIDAHRKRQQAAHPGLTLTGMYNVLEALRSSRALTQKEKAIHTDGLVAVLASLHAELDAAVLSAYGWDDLGPGADQPGALLTRLVALNAQRAREEAAGHIRWLRPAFQDPSQRAAQSNTLLNQELSVLHSIGLQADLALENTLPQPASSAAGPAAAHAAQAAAHAATQAAAPQAWPADLPAQVRAVAQVLASASAALTLPQLEAHFKGRGAWKNSLPRILATLEALGKAQNDGAGWRA